MKKILFYTANGVGLGHLQRTRLIAERLRTKNIKIILVTPARYPYLFGKFFDQLVKLAPLSDELLKNPAKTFAVRLSNGRKFAQALKKFRPDIIIADFYLTSSFTFYAFSFAVGQFPTKSIFIWRLEDANKFSYDIKNETARLNYFQKIILPHGREELKELLPGTLWQYVKDNSKFGICGPIFRKPDRKKMAFCRRKYKVFSTDFLITITVGSGGKLEQGRCEKPNKVIEKFLAIYPRLVDKIPNLKTIIVTGPYFKNFGKESFPRLKIIRFEKNLPELMNLSNLVISTAGYNTCNELIETKTPAILVPLLRGAREQFERASYFEHKEVAKSLKNISSKSLLSSILECRPKLNKMKDNFKNFSDIKPGNKKAAEIILSLIK